MYIVHKDKTKQYKSNILHGALAILKFNQCGGDLLVCTILNEFICIECGILNEFVQNKQTNKDTAHWSENILTWGLKSRAQSCVEELNVKSRDDRVESRVAEYLRMRVDSPQH